MIILKHKWNKKKVRKLVDYLYTAKASHDPMTHYMNKELSNEMLYYLLQNPSHFANYYFYQQFVEMYFPEFASEHPTYTNMLIQMAMVNDMKRRQRRHQRMYEINYQRLLNDTRQIRNDKRITHNMQLNVDLDRILRETTIDLTAQHEQTLERTINQLNKAIEKEGLIDIPDIKKNKKLQEKLEKYRKQIIRENKRLEKNKTNRVLWQKARLLDDKYKPTFKVWDQHPNPKTRHNLTDGQKVKLEEKFIVINDKTGDIDYVDYPGDWTCSASNSANCLCTLSFTNDPKGYKPHEKLNEYYKKKSEKIKSQNTLNKKQKEINKNIIQMMNNKDTYEVLDYSVIEQDEKKLNKESKKHTHQKYFLPKEFKKHTFKFIKDFYNEYKGKTVEYAKIYDYISGRVSKEIKGIPERGRILYGGWISGTVLSIHQHYKHTYGLSAPSGQDVYHLLTNPEVNYVLVSNMYGEVWFMKSINLSKNEAKEIKEHMDKIFNVFNEEYYDNIDRVNKIINEEYKLLEEEYKKISPRHWKIKLDSDRRRLIQEYHNKFRKERNEKVSKQYIYYLNKMGIETDRVLLE
ncbi:hypothetical protein [Methanosphaera sp.]|uniref:hypothetical protein n=1 Tax=Methanosphaera sp. TaxID=2666342 RepID=UPI0025F55A2F|nr:hypothetical protein [Methanosphaera sp.]